MNTEILSYFGLSRNDVRVYEALLRLGRSKTGPLIKEATIVSSRIYESLRILVDKGLVSYEVRNNIKYYQAEVPNQLVEEAEQKINTLKALSGEITHSPINHVDRNETNVFEGKHGFRMAFTQHTEGLREGERVGIIAFSVRSFTGTGTRELRSFFTNLDKMMISKKSKGRLLTERRMGAILEKDRIDAEIYDLRFLPSGYFGPSAINLSEKEVLLSVWGEKPIVFRIRNPTIVNSFWNNFEFLWGMGKK